MSIITLTSDFGYKDYFVAAAKARLLSLSPSSVVIDLSHELDAFNIAEAAYIVNGASKHFPKDTVHLVLVDYERNREQNHVIVKLYEHFFIAADNGILSLLTANHQQFEIFKIKTLLSTEQTSDFEILLKIAAHLANKGSVDAIAEPVAKLADTVAPSPSIANNKTEIHGSAIYFDRFGNIVTNISKQLFDSISNNRNFKIDLPGSATAGVGSITKIVAKYSDVAVDERFKIAEYGSQSLAIFNDAGFLEIAVFRSNPERSGSAKSLLGVKYLDPIVITFK